MESTEASILEQTRLLVSETNRQRRISAAVSLGKTISYNIGQVDPDWVFGEKGVPYWGTATTHLIERRTINPIEAWMVAETVATGAATAHTIATGEIVSDEEFSSLTEHLALGAIALTQQIYQIN